MPSVAIVQILARTGLDFLIIDMEHGAIGPADAHAMIAATAGTPVTPFIRVAAMDPTLAKGPLDWGALGVCFPMVNTRQPAAAAVAAVRYPPAGERAWGPFFAPARWGQTAREYESRANEAVLSIITLEHHDAVEEIGAIVGVGGLDLAFIGPGDLATSLGYVGQPDHPEVSKITRLFEWSVLRSGVALGGVARSPREASEMIGRGYRALVLGFDWSLLQKGADSVLDGIVDRAELMDPDRGQT